MGWGKKKDDDEERRRENHKRLTGGKTTHTNTIRSLRTRLIVRTERCECATARDHSTYE